MHSVLHSLAYQAALGMTPIGGGLAIFKGGKPERYGAAAFIAAIAVTDSFFALAPVFHYSTAGDLPYFDLAATFVLSFFFLYLAVRYASLWLAAAMVVQGSELYFARAYIEAGPSGLFAYGLQLNLICVTVLTLLAGAAVLSWRARVTARHDEARRSAQLGQRLEEQARRFEDMLKDSPATKPALKPAPGRVARLIIEPPPI